MSDIALISTPSQDYYFPAPSIFFLKGALEKHNIPSTCFDLNHKFMSKFKEDGLLWCQTGKEFKPEFDEFILEYYNTHLKNFKNLCLSVFTYNSQNFTRRFLELIRPLTSAKIIIGGAGIESQSGVAKNFDNVFFDKEMLDKNLVDVVIKNEGDISLPNYFKNIPYNFNQLDDISDIAYSNFDDISFDDYVSKTVFINGSRGCVRRCTFCDIGHYWKKYRFRPGNKIAEELIYHYEKYGVTNFAFSDSLVNGNMKEFRLFCSTLAKKNLPVEWEGQFIFRNGTTEKDWDNIQMSGCKRIWIGIESGSEKIRNDMDKKFTNKALYDSIENAGKRNIMMNFLLLVGYPTETLNEYEETLELLRKSKKYKNLIRVYVNPAMILPNTPMERMDWYDTMDNWKFINEEGEINFKERYRRWLETNKLAIDIGYKIKPDYNEQKTMLDMKLKELYD